MVLELMRFTEMVGVSLSVQSAELLCRSLAMRRVYCLVLLDSPSAALQRAARDLEESHAMYQGEVAQIRESGGEVAEDEVEFHYIMQERADSEKCLCDSRRKRGPSATKHFCGVDWSCALPPPHLC
ncbi:unnamed protein product [Symbiodinium sp. CCMP2592]|nr:unnamed protein product [Symbiodinium sp. CCMP2592]